MRVKRKRRKTLAQNVERKGPKYVYQLRHRPVLMSLYSIVISVPL